LKGSHELNLIYVGDKFKKDVFKDRKLIKVKDYHYSLDLKQNNFPKQA